jgi:hypothetical protein
MKYLFILLMASFAYVGASAQNYSRSAPYVNNYGQTYADQFQRRLNEINYIYDGKITDAKNDYTLSNHRKKKMIRLLEEERKLKIKAYKKWARKEKRKLRREDYDYR